ncbi:MAG: sensor histidine kinase [Thermodesulfobacteriota bacterium]
MALWKKKGTLKESSQEGREPFIDLLIHDLSGSLSIVSTSVAALQHTERYGPLTEAQKKIVERIARNTLKAQLLIQEIFEIARSKEGLFKREYFSIEKVIRESIIEVLEMIGLEGIERLYKLDCEEEFRQCLKSYGIYVEVVGKWGHAPFCHDSKKIQQIIRNLMSNAMKYRRTRVDISVSGERELLISVKDDGRGIPQEDQAMLFQRFSRLREKTNSGIPGLGLGLAGVKTLVEAMAGEIILESKEGIGTCFTVRVPPFNL